MRESRWRLHLGMSALVVLAAATVTSTSLGAGRPSATVMPPPCPGSASGTLLDTSGTGDPRELRMEPWFRIDPELSVDGALEGRQLLIGRYGSSGSRSITLAAESFAAGPHGRAVLFGSDDGTRSALGLFDAARDCVVDLGDEPDVIRGATLDPAGTAIYEHRVERRSRTDLGVFRRPLAAGTPVRVIAPLAPDDAYGVTYSTELAWSAEGDALAVQACGAVLCRTRVLDVRTGDVATVAGTHQAAFVGLAEGRLVTYAPCGGLPCPIVSTSVATGTSMVLAEAAGLATLAFTAEGPRVVHETGHGSLRVVTASGRHERSVPVPDADLRLVPRTSRSGGGAPVPAGWIALAPEARLEPGEAVPGLLLRLADGAAWGPEEAAR